MPATCTGLPHKVETSNCTIHACMLACYTASSNVHIGPPEFVFIGGVVER